MNEVVLNEISDSLKLLFEEAEKKGLWFFSAYQQLWFSHEELLLEQVSGHFRWGTANWSLRDPKERLDELRRDAENAVLAAINFEKKLLDR